jgi:hypothetical protein
MPALRYNRQRFPPPGLEVSSSDSELDWQGHSFAGPRNPGV